MLRIVIFISLSILLFACKEEIQFQSCSLHSKLIGEWEGINSDSKNTFKIGEKGLIVKKYGVERRLTFQPVKCKTFTYQNTEHITYFDKKGSVVAGFGFNSTFDTIITGASAQDWSLDTNLIGQMKFIKIK